MPTTRQVWTFPLPIALMSSSRPKDEARDFAAMFGEIAVSLNPQYTANRAAKGAYCEFIREVSPGIYASHNSTYSRGTYYHCFCLALHLELSTPWLKSPFVVGGRFSHNQTVSHDFIHYLGRDSNDPANPFRLSDSHSFRKGCDQIIARCCTEAEQHLIPNFIRVYDAAREALLELCEVHQSLGKIPCSPTSDHRRGFHLWDGQDLDMAEFSLAFPSRTDSRREFLMDVISAKPQLFNRILPRIPAIIGTLRNR